MACTPVKFRECWKKIATSEEVFWSKLQVPWTKKTWRWYQAATERNLGTSSDVGENQDHILCKRMAIITDEIGGIFWINKKPHYMKTRPMK